MGVETRAVVTREAETAVEEKGVVGMEMVVAAMVVVVKRAVVRVAEEMDGMEVVAWATGIWEGGVRLDRLVVMAVVVKVGVGRAGVVEAVGVVE